ncbi:MAG: hypothetical protein RLZZ347_219 [Candidatus Parcubacteria bacterium]|jgi:hypothetical protein
MTNYLHNAFKKLPDTAVPTALHNATYRAVMFLKYRRYLKIAIALTAVTFLFSIWHVYTKLIETDALSVIQAIANTIDLTFDSIYDSFSTAFEFLPIQALILSTLNLLALICAIFFAQTFTRFQQQSEMRLK